MQTQGTFLLIGKEELEEFAKSMRRTAKQLGDTDAARDLMKLADQFQNASCGYDVNAEPKSYDKPPEAKPAEPPPQT